MDLLDRLEESGCTCLVCNHSFKLSDFFNFDLNEEASKEFVDVTPQLLKQEYDYLNGKFFGKKLGNYPIKTNRRRESAGLTKIVVRYNGSDKTYTVEGIQISIWQNVTLSALRSVIAHEMIHVSMAENGVEMGHGPVFIEEMNRINRANDEFKVNIKRDIDDVETAFKGGKKRAVFVFRSPIRPNAIIVMDLKNIKQAAENIIMLMGTKYLNYELGFDIWVSDYPMLDGLSVTRVASLEKGIPSYTLKKEDIDEIQKGDYAGYVDVNGYRNSNAKIDLSINREDLGKKKLDAVSYIVIMMDDVKEAALVLPYKEKEHAIAWLGLAYKGIKDSSSMVMYKSSVDWLKAIVAKPKWPWKTVPEFYRLKLEKSDEIRNNSDKLGEFIVTRGWVPQ